MQGLAAVPEARQQTFDEIYGPPENYLEIEVLSLLLLVHSARPDITYPPFAYLPNQCIR